MSGFLDPCRGKDEPRAMKWSRRNASDDHPPLLCSKARSWAPRTAGETRDCEQSRVEHTRWTPGSRRSPATQRSSQRRPPRQQRARPKAAREPKDRSSVSDSTLAVPECLNADLVHTTVAYSVAFPDPARQPWVEKYRPKTIEDVAAQEHTVTVLRKTLSSSNVRALQFVHVYSLQNRCIVNSLT